MNIFTKEVTFVSPTEWDATANNGMGAHVEGEVTKTATFKELSRTDRDQRGIQFMLTGIYKSKGLNEVTVDKALLAEVTEEFIEVMLIPGPGFSDNDKTQFLNDNIAFIMFGMWLLKEKIAPFFALLAESLTK